jgi:predicted DNA-binding transcriptional regulator YafY
MAIDRRRRRQHQILVLLRTRELVSASELAERFDVNVRTIYRDIEDMLQSHVPIQGTPGPEGGYRLRPEAAIDPAVFDSEDAFELYLSQVLRKDEAHASITREIAEGDSEFAELAKALLDRKIYFDPHDTYWRDEGSGLVPDVRRALLASEAIAVRWGDRGLARRARAHEEVIVPLGLVWKAGHWYVVARGLDGLIFRERLANLSKIDRTGLSFVAPDDFDLESWWAEEMEAYGKGDLRIVFVASPTAAPDLRRLNRKKESVFEDLEDGGLRVTLFADNWHWLVPILASYGPEVLVEEPAEFRREMETTFCAAAAAYKSDRSATQRRSTGDRATKKGDTRMRSTRGRPT